MKALTNITLPYLRQKSLSRWGLIIWVIFFYNSFSLASENYIFFSGMFEDKLTQPFMFMYSKDSQGTSDFFYCRAENTVYAVTIAGSAHANYADLSLVGGFQKLTGQRGKIDGNRCIKIINDYMLNFFDKHLKGNGSSLLDGPSPDYPEVEFKSRNNNVKIMIKSWLIYKP